MIATTYNCGCPIPKSFCSPCCFRPSETGSEASKYIRPISGISCCNCKSFRCTLSCREHTSTRHIPSVQCANCCSMIMSKDNISGQYSRSESDSSLKKLGTDASETPSEKIVSEIVKKEQPYKEIEAIINDNRVIVRMHKEPVREVYDPPCECIGQDEIAKESTSSLKKCDNGVTFEMANGSLELCRTPQEDARLTKETYEKEEPGCRTITVYPQADVRDTESGPTVSHDEKKKKDKNLKVRSIDLEENPNIFLLRIKKQCGGGDKKHKIDLEFRAPRPWLPRKDKKKELSSNLSEKLAE